ncbi:hypothetical protein KAM345_015120 [Aeromonas caviae]|uniref:hypothetical protein n=1 Tax=Aeromonas caviae TaxID=648 RepID=UPI001CC7A014|nr:hypothetical protein [Aeromonas caviae]BDA17598.1 hypothetical protein KAM345_015120 [Aeromonas caviae]
MKPKLENRAMQAILRYSETRQEVERLTGEIAFELEQCPQEADYPKRPHLIEAYTATTTEDHYGGHQSERRLTIEEAAEYLDEIASSGICGHCRKAHTLIQQRKKARIRHGRAKATITKLGRELLEVGAAGGETA